MTIEQRKNFCESLEAYSNSLAKEPHNLQNVWTPLWLCYDVIQKLSEYTTFDGKTFCCLNIGWVEVLIYSFGVPKEFVTFATDCEKKAILKEYPRYNGVKVVLTDFLDMEAIMKFDFVVMNPPYHTKSDKNDDKTQAIWPGFVKKAFSICKENGFVVSIHPSGWRDVRGMFEETKDLLLSKCIKYLEMHDMNDGVKTFGEQTNYDWYVAKNTFGNSSNGEKTHVKGQDGTEYDIDIPKLNFVPSRLFNEILCLLAKDGETRTEVLYDRTAYGSDKKNVSKEKHDEFKYPCIYSIKMGDIPTLWYSSNNDNGHFGVPKFIWGNGVCTSIGSIVDADGEYGLTQFGYAIVDSKENLPLIKKAFDSARFKEIMKACPNQNNNINRKVIELFRKDFWKEFVDENGNEI
jgi:predicted RNA methylase